MGMLLSVEKHVLLNITYVFCLLQKVGVYKNAVNLFSLKQNYGTIISDKYYNFIHVYKSREC